MPVVRRIGVGLVGAVLIIAIATCQPTPAQGPAAGSQPLSAGASQPTPQPADAIVWGKVPYCNCLADSATTNVADALKKANLAVSLQELSPRDGWLYFAVTFEPQAATVEQVGAAMVAGGAQVLEGPP